MTPPFFARASMVREVLDRMEVGLAPDAHRFEIGNQNYLGLWVLGRSVEFLGEVGLAHRGARAGVDDVSDGTAGESGREDSDPSPLGGARRHREHRVARPPESGVARLREKRVIASARNNGLRFAPHFYNTEEELERVVGLL